jgi:hypothetical protein
MNHALRVLQRPTATSTEMGKRRMTRAAPAAEPRIRLPRVAPVHACGRDQCARHNAEDGYRPPRHPSKRITAFRAAATSESMTPLSLRENSACEMAANRLVVAGELSPIRQALFEPEPQSRRQGSLRAGAKRRRHHVFAFYAPPPRASCYNHPRCCSRRNIIGRCSTPRAP